MIKPRNDKKIPLKEVNNHLKTEGEIFTGTEIMCRHDQVKKEASIQN